MSSKFRGSFVWLKKGHPIILGVTLLIVLIGTITLSVYLCIGYRFAIFDNARPDWEAISAILSFLAALGAIGAAVFIPWRIAQQQNKIALFGIKHESYAEIHKLLCFADSISNYLFEKHTPDKIKVNQAFDEMKKPSMILNSMAVIFGFEYDETQTEKKDLMLFLTKLKATEYLIKKSLYLFDYIDTDDVRKMTLTCQDFLLYVLRLSANPLILASDGGDDSTGRAFISACHHFMDRYEKKIDEDISF
jgi:hypothetical protein